ncbi:(3R)-hydroxyacyl-ACP dehydratase subunit HadB [Tsukamurella tyrosinosolvens]|jgi:acyl dehydratase|uniref:(3R)-hydroxyacyl-ACP dehydratase subunit HadB n=3 Tax=Tsukamurella TaxID=2060 RepID=A0A5C5S3D9_9ACTN|nr:MULTISPECIES: (3R)-hydroxyacyl-ACP dehydratase subunit HadB [Tsukamurella]AUN39242.1 3-hydroxyacyl-ACP dehydratase [Tsukamurella tyrosinosolvens]KXO96964.1 3-hydroxyacyl-ACP dehydratase [Tsukamurella tyrosinosolvens]KXP02507.1 3-hydroxyacyl-ACP dehydratase [Tsukamurella tyrosinosolvens]KZL96645.1 3-hydroxyacyl-ACP dehydratase [Tsukamurella tyrosinosolvens]MCA4996547.1 (3R)-hydroxyacyl-ACP dehydratase subunit HadB [Tsukamurella tyrosinosolvens]
MALRNFADVTVGEELPERTFELTRGDLVNYAGVTGDPNPIHWSDHIVKLAGMEDVVAQGMLTMSLGSNYITEWLGDPGALKEYSVRFTAPVFVPADQKAELLYSGKIKSLDEETKTGVVFLTVKQGERKIFGKPVATVQFA